MAIEPVKEGKCVIAGHDRKALENSLPLCHNVNRRNGKGYSDRCGRIFRLKEILTENIR